jgi:hypothetical protein
VAEFFQNDDFSEKVHGIINLFVKVICFVKEKRDIDQMTNVDSILQVMKKCTMLGGELISRRAILNITANDSHLLSANPGAGPVPACSVRAC